MADLFISYAREDRECAQTLARALSERGWTVWWDREIHVGQSFSEVIERELDRAKCVIVLWSRNSVASDWVQNEAAEAARRRSLVPVRIEDVRPPLEFRRLQTADLLDWRSGFNNPEFEACISSIEHLVGNTATKPLPSRPPTHPGRSPLPQPPAQPQPPQQQQQQHPAPPPHQQPHQQQLPARPQQHPVTPPQQRPYTPPQQQHPVTPPQQRPYTPQQQQPPFQQHYRPPQQQLPVVPNYMVPAILVTVACCLPLGIVALVNSAQVNTKLQAGDVAGAMQASAKAKSWSWIAFGVGLVLLFVYLLLALAGSV